MPTFSQNRAIVRASAAYDLVTTLGFATPWTVAPTLALVFGAGGLFGLDVAPPGFDATQMLFVNLMGSTVLVWSLARLAFPTPAMGRFDALSRGLFAVWEVWAVLRGASPVILGFTVLEIAFGIAELLPVKDRVGDRT